MKEQPAVNETMASEVQDPTYIRWLIYDEIPKRLYTIESEGYFDKNGTPLENEISIKNLTGGEQVDIDAELEICDENGNTNDY